MTATEKLEALWREEQEELDEMESRACSGAEYIRSSTIANEWNRDNTGKHAYFLEQGKKRKVVTKELPK